MSIYDERPWLGAYADGVPAELEAAHPTVLAAFREGVERDPDAPLVHFADTTLSLGDLDGRSDALAVGLAERGVGPGDRVAVLLQNVPTYPITVLAAWKRGASVVPVNPMSTAKDFGFLVRDAGAHVLVAAPDLLAGLGEQAVTGAGVEHVVSTAPTDLAAGRLPPALRSWSHPDVGGAVHLATLLERHAGDTPEPLELTPDAPAFLTYTSGTTGPPKGAINTHGNVAFNAEVYRAWMDLGRDDVCLAVAPLFHITGSVAHLAVALRTGMPMVLGYRFDAADTLALIERHGCTFTVGSITVFIALMNDPSAGERDVSSLRKVFSGGAPIAPPTVAAFQAEVGAYIHNIYGMTETTSPSHAVPMGTSAPVDPRSGALSVGVPVPSTVVRIVDEDGADLPPGQIGELVTAGPQVVPGYWGNPEQTARAIDERGMHTGDVGFMDDDGFFYLVDRKKDMIVASGYKVWPREVEDVLYEHPAVREAGVVGVPDDYRGETVKAFVSLRPGTAAEPEELVAFCRERLAAYKYPRAVEIVDELPKTATGKILRRELGGDGTPR